MFNKYLNYCLFDCYVGWFYSKGYATFCLDNAPFELAAVDEKKTKYAVRGSFAFATGPLANAIKKVAVSKLSMSSVAPQVPVKGLAQLLQVAKEVT